MTLSVINKQERAGKAGAARPLRAVAGLSTSAVSCRLGVTGIAPLSLFLTVLLPETHTLTLFTDQITRTVFMFAGTFSSGWEKI